MSLVSEIVQKEYDKNPDINPRDVESILNWIKDQPHLPHEYITDLDVIMAYHSCNCSIEQTKAVIDLNFTWRTLANFYQDRIVDNRRMEVAFHTWLMAPLTTPTSKGYKAVYCELLNPDPEVFIYSDVIRAFVMIMDLWQWEEGAVAGVAVVVNMDRVTLAHLSRIDLAVAQQFFYFLQEAMFVRLKEFHFINAPSFIDSLMTMVSPFMKRDLLDMLRVHRAGSDTWDEFIPRSALPREAGGNNRDGKALRDEIWNKIKENKTFFDDESKKRVNESKRPGGPKTMSSFFSGLESSFKKLEID